MSTCGAGRGRGWLNLTKNAEAPKPMGLPVTAEELPLPPKTPINIEYQELINRLKEISVNDDGIMLNKKLNFVRSYLLEHCSNKEEVESSFDHVYSACLNDPDFASKIVLFVSSRSLQTDEIHNCNLRHSFLRCLQKDFDNCLELQSTNPRIFRNCVRMLGEFTEKAKTPNGKPYGFTSTPLVKGLGLLLNSKNLPDLILFTNQLFSNGKNLNNSVPQELSSLGVKVRTILTTESHLVKDAKCWLLLALDLLNARFGTLPPEVYKFYEDQLGSNVMVNFQTPHDPLSIQTVHFSKILDSYKSNVNVLQLSTSPTEAPQNDTSSTQYTCNDLQKTNLPEDLPQKSKEKAGRPILGVGARFAKNESNSNGNKTYNPPGRIIKNHQTSAKSKKGWEHDDRFDNDYS